MGVKEVKDSKEIKLALILKTNKLKREALSSITYEHLSSTMYEHIWKNKPPNSIHEAINDIAKIDISTIVGFLSYDAIQKGSTMDNDDIISMLKGDFYE